MPGYLRQGGICGTNAGHLDNGFPLVTFAWCGAGSGTPQSWLVLRQGHGAPCFSWSANQRSHQESMMTSVHSVLVVGGGFAGCALATLLGRRGVAVEIAERKADFTVYGSGITLQGAALRVLREVGVWDELRQYGYDFDSLGIRSADGQLLAEL